MNSFLFSNHDIIVKLLFFDAFKFNTILNLICEHTFKKSTTLGTVLILHVDSFNKTDLLHHLSYNYFKKIQDTLN